MQMDLALGELLRLMDPKSALKPRWGFSELYGSGDAGLFGLN
jgi:hypothetical protein